VSDKFSEAKKLVYVHSILAERSPGDPAVLVMRDGSFRAIIKTGAVNFDMKSPQEQKRLCYGFGSMCNSLEEGFAIQILSHSKLVDVQTYRQQYQQRLKNRNTSEKMRKLMASHLQHFESQVAYSRIMQRENFVVISWKGDPKLNEKSALDDVPFVSMFAAVKENVEEKMALANKPNDMEISLAQNQIDIRTRHICSRLSGLGIWTKPLRRDEVRRLIYSYFHPDLSERQRDPGIENENLVSGFSNQNALPSTQRSLGGNEEDMEF